MEANRTLIIREISGVSLNLDMPLIAFQRYFHLHLQVKSLQLWKYLSQ